MRKPRNDDRDNPPLTEEDFVRAKRSIGHLPQPAQDALRTVQRRYRGQQKSPTKELISIRLNRGAVAAFRRTGPGWQARINDTVVRAAATLEAASTPPRRRRRSR